MPKQNKIKDYLYSEHVSEKFLMLPPDLLTDPTFQELTFAERYFYITIAVHRETNEQRYVLEKTLKEYRPIVEELSKLSDDDIKDQAYINKHTKHDLKYFVMPESQLKQYGFTKSYVTKIKKGLIEKGFIRIVCGGKGKYTAWKNNITLYQFCNIWKKADTNTA